MYDIAYLQFDSRKKNKEWVTKVLTEFRISGYKSVLNKDSCDKNRQVINSEYSLEKIRQMWKNPEQLEKAGYEFVQISILERFKNILISEGLQQEIKAYVDAQDPSLIRLKKEDKQLLMNKRLVEDTVNTLKSSIGLPPTKIGNDDFHGNYDSFEAMAFDSGSQSDISTWFDIFYQLDVESDFQSIINHTNNVNVVADLLPEFREDIMATKMIAYRTFLNRITGQPTIRRIKPEHILRVQGLENAKDQKADIAVGYQESITVAEFIKRVGSTFDFINNIDKLIMGVNNVSPIDFSGIVMADGSTINTNAIGTNTISFSAFMNYRVQVGYVEFKTVDSTYYKMNKNGLNNVRAIEMKEDDDINTLKKNGYQITSEAKERTYYADYLETSALDQYVINYGRVYLQETEGAEDEISAFTLRYKFFSGKTFAEVAKPWIDIASEAFHKFKYLLRKAKEDGKSYNIESLIRVGEKMLNLDGSPASVKQVFDLFEDSINEAYSNPVVNGQEVPSQGDVHRQIVREYDSKFKSFTEIISWAVEQIKANTGINDLRAGESPTTNDVYKLEKASLEKANNVTYYASYMIDTMFREIGVSIIQQTMDVIRYKQSLGVKYITNIIGEEGVKRLQSLPKISPHRMDIFVLSFANYQDRIQVLKDAQFAFQQKMISYTDLVLINSVNDFRKARKLLIIKEQQAKIEEQKQLDASRQHEMGLEKMKHGNRIEEINAKGGWEVKKMQVQADGFKEAARENQRGRLTVEQQKKSDKEDEMTLKNQLKEQEAFGVKTQQE